MTDQPETQENEQKSLKQIAEELQKEMDVKHPGKITVMVMNGELHIIRNIEK